MTLRQILLILIAMSSSVLTMAQRKNNVIDQVVWVVGDDPILLSEIEEARLAAEASGSRMANPYCIIPENLAVQKLFLHEADLDSIYADEGLVDKRVNAWLEEAIQYYGSRENVEAWSHRTISQLRNDRKRALRNESRVEQVQQKIVKHVKVTPAEVRAYFKDLPLDSLPYVPQQVEVQIITFEPVVSREEIRNVEKKLREFAKKVNDGESEFSTLARFYSQDEATARNGGELGYKSRGQLVPEYANVAFSLNDPKKVSKIVKTDFGYHIIQLIDKRGDKVNTRHILLRAEIPDSDYIKGEERLDSLASIINKGKISFEEAATEVSDDKDTRNNNGLMNNINMETGTITARFEMKDLNQDIAKVVDTLKVGEISKAFTFVDKKGQKVCAIVKLKNRIDGHRANMTEDYQKLKAVVYGIRCQEKIDEWIEKKAKTTYVRIMPEWRNCKFKYQWQ